MNKSFFFLLIIATLSTACNKDVVTGKEFFEDKSGVYNIDAFILKTSAGDSTVCNDCGRLVFFHNNANSALFDTIEHTLWVFPSAPEWAGMFGPATSTEHDWYDVKALNENLIYIDFINPDPFTLEDWVEHRVDYPAEGREVWKRYRDGQHTVTIELTEKALQ